MSALDGDRVLITGGASGIGRAVVDRFVEEGARVVVLDRSEDGLKELRMAHGDDIRTVQGDVSVWADNERAVERAVEEFGRLDKFVGNAGVFDNMISLEELSGPDLDEAFDELFSTNVLGYLLGAKAARPALMDSEGTMIFTASCASFTAGTGGVLYTPSKHAVAGLIRQLAHDLAPTIRVNGVAPGYVPTNLGGLDSLDQAQTPAEKSLVQSVYPLELSGAADYASYYVFLASDDGAVASTGTILEADNGLCVRGLPLDTTGADE